MLRKYFLLCTDTSRCNGNLYSLLPANLNPDLTPYWRVYVRSIALAAIRRLISVYIKNNVSSRTRQLPYDTCFVALNLAINAYHLGSQVSREV